MYDGGGGVVGEVRRGRTRSNLMSLALRNLLSNLTCKMLDFSDSQCSTAVQNLYFILG